MIKVGITGETGFIGTHLRNTIAIKNDLFELVPFRDEFFINDHLLTTFVASCDAIVHLAAVNRHENPQVIFDTNIQLVIKLIKALEKTNRKVHVLISSSIQEDIDNSYGRSKKICREKLAEWAAITDSLFTGFVFPNIFGPFGNPSYNSFIATFSHQIAHGEIPNVELDKKVPLLYVGDTVNIIIAAILEKKNDKEYRIKHSTERNVTEILELLNSYKSTYLDHGIIPTFNSPFEIDLFNTFRSYIDIRSHFPIKYLQHKDNRGEFLEIIQHGSGGQVSFSSLKPSLTRGNHFHTRKIERFSVIKGKCLIQLRRYGTKEVLDFYLSGEEPSYIDIPIWYSHCITNIGKEELYTIFWINEFYNPSDADTFFEQVNNTN